MVLFVTGGSRGIGRAIVEAAVVAGHDVAFTYREAGAAAEEVVDWARAHEPDARCRAYRLDVRDAAEVERVGDQVLDDFEAVDAVVCNAGILRNGVAAQMSDADWNDVLATNLTGSFYVARHFLMPFLAQGRGRLVFIGSLAQNGISGQANYSASKAGLVGLSKALAKEYGRKGITANVVVPGFFDTDLTREGMASGHKDFWNTYCPLGRMGHLDELARVVLFLASGASSFVNGAEIPVTGGLDWAS
ncbi:MAG: SDR family oxidoreductase [Alphaproteobacteria bacterium]|nr:SDR family oxidoreductase [Alphaproteobacteria bacterium]